MLHTCASVVYYWRGIIQQRPGENKYSSVSCHDLLIVVHAICVIACVVLREKYSISKSLKCKENLGAGKNTSST